MEIRKEIQQVSAELLRKTKAMTQGDEGFTAKELFKYVERLNAIDRAIGQKINAIRTAVKETTENF